MMKLTIPTPCSEDYLKMSTSERGAFCDSCKKEVIDFTLLSEYQLLEVLQNNNSKVCGRFRLDQLQQEYKNLNQSRGSQSSWIAAVFSAFMILSSSTSKGEIKSHLVPLVQFNHHNKDLSDRRASPQTDSLKLIKGRIVDENGEGLPGASIQLKGKDIKAVSGTDGGFELTIPEDTKLSEAELQINFIGYVPLLKSLKEYNGKEIRMALQPAILGGIEVIAGRVVCEKPTLWNRLMNLFK